MTAASAAGAQQATRTATPAPRLSGGFGRPRAESAPTPAPAGGQSLADVVQAAHEPHEVAPSGKSALTINNRSLVTDTARGRVSTAAGRPTASHKAAVTPKAAGEGTRTVTAAPDAPAGPASATGGTEAEWRARAQSDRKRVADGRSRVAELDAAARKLENDFYAWDDGQYRDRVIKPAWDKARSELATAKDELAQAEKDLADLPEKARRAGALPGWIRE